MHLNTRCKQGPGCPCWFFNIVMWFLGCSCWFLNHCYVDSSMFWFVSTRVLIDGCFGVLGGFQGNARWLMGCSGGLFGSCLLGLLQLIGREFQPRSCWVVEFNRAFQVSISVYCVPSFFVNMLFNHIISCLFKPVSLITSKSNPTPQQCWQHKRFRLNVIFQVRCLLQSLTLKIILKRHHF